MRPPYFLQHLIDEAQKNGNGSQGQTQSGESENKQHSHPSSGGDSARHHEGNHSRESNDSRSAKGSDSHGSSSRTKPSGHRSQGQSSRDTQSSRSEHSRARASRRDDSGYTPSSGTGKNREGLYTSHNLAAFQPDSADISVVGGPEAETHIGPSTNWQSVFKRSGFPLSLVKAYGWNIKQVEFKNNLIRVQTPKGTYALKRGHLSPEKVSFLQEAFLYLKQQGFEQYAPLSRAASGKHFVVRNSQTYYASKWINGQPVNFASLNQVREVARTLAEFHEQSRGFEAESYSPKSEFAVDELLRERTEDLKAILGRAQTRSEPDGFDKILANHASELREAAEKSMRLVETTQVLTFLRDDEETPGLCHLDVIPGNFIYTPEGRAVAIDFDLSTYAPRALDLSHLLRRALQQQRWLTDVAYSCFVEYNRVRAIAGPEYRLIEALLRFPYRVWRVSHSRYRLGPMEGQEEEIESAIREWSRRELFLDSFSRQIQD